jgi:hypothetical protein
MKHPECGDSVPVEIELVPRQPVASRLRVGVMIIVPALTKGQHRHPEAVFGSIAGKKPLPPHI